MVINESFSGRMIPVMASELEEASGRLPLAKTEILSIHLTLHDAYESIDKKRVSHLARPSYVSSIFGEKIDILWGHLKHKNIKTHCAKQYQINSHSRQTRNDLKGLIVSMNTFYDMKYITRIEAHTIDATSYDICSASIASEA
jgi:hypothetical protein